MSRKPIQKELENTRLASSYGSWIYCEGCSNVIGYLCYVTYDMVKLEYMCNCGNYGDIDIRFENNAVNTGHQPLVLVKNRLCCPADKAPLITVLKKRLKAYKCEIVCNTCNTIYLEEQEVTKL